jgi:hypothetical protein
MPLKCLYNEVSQEYMGSCISVLGVLTACMPLKCLYNEVSQEYMGSCISVPGVLSRIIWGRVYVCQGY